MLTLSITLTILLIILALLSFLLRYWGKDHFDFKMNQLGIAVISNQFQAVLLGIVSSLIFLVSSMAGPLATILSKSISGGVVTSNILNVIAIGVAIYALRLWNKK